MSLGLEQRAAVGRAAIAGAAPTSMRVLVVRPNGATIGPDGALWITQDGGMGHGPRVATAATAMRASTDAHRLVHLRWSEGELGRPRDDLDEVTFVATRPHKLLIGLSEQVLAVLTDARLVSASPAEVVVAYEQLTADWQGGR
ncbi:MAG: hypothetical protein QM733_00620 [Ilumatobacteraceae bacterium]